MSHNAPVFDSTIVNFDLSLCAFPKLLLLSREEFKERLISDPLLELLAKPAEKLASMKTLDLTTRLANSDRALPLLLQAIPFFIEKGVGEQGEVPEAHERSGTHELILAQTGLFLAIGKRTSISQRAEMCSNNPCAEVFRSLDAQ
jgi:hypothetical protein